MSRTILALTTTGQRAELAGFALESLLGQSAQADAIHVYISEQPYLQDQGLTSVPEWPRAWQDPRVVVRWVQNTGPYRKLLPILETANPQDRIVTCDDDVLYGRDWLATLLAADDPNRPAILCGRARRLQAGWYGRLRSFAEWPKVERDVEGHDLLPVGMCGVVYRPAWLHVQFIRDSKFLELAPKEDDLWFRAASAAVGTPVRVAHRASELCYQINTPSRLYSVNVLRKGKRRPTSRRSPALVRRFERLKSALGGSLTPNDRQILGIRRYVTEAYRLSDPFRPAESEISSKRG